GVHFGQGIGDGPGQRNRVRHRKRAALEALLEGLAFEVLGIGQRDLKPANVVLTARGPRILDFGISAVNGSGRRTAADDLLGTPPATGWTPAGARPGLRACGSRDWRCCNSRC